MSGSEKDAFLKLVENPKEEMDVFTYCKIMYIAGMQYEKEENKMLHVIVLCESCGWWNVYLRKEKDANVFNYGRFHNGRRYEKLYESIYRFFRRYLCGY